MLIVFQHQLQIVAKVIKYCQSKFYQCNVQKIIDLFLLLNVIANKWIQRLTECVKLRNVVPQSENEQGNIIPLVFTCDRCEQLASQCNLNCLVFTDYLGSV